eukprot:Gb_33764 [translate_table: standard]
MATAQGQAHGYGHGQMTAAMMDKALPATRLLEKCRLMFQMQEALECQKIEFARIDIIQPNPQNPPEAKAPSSDQSVEVQILVEEGCHHSNAPLLELVVATLFSINTSCNG